MAYSLPTFNLIVSIWHDGTPLTNPPDDSCFANLAMGRRTTKDDQAFVPYDPTQLPTLDLLCPIGTDIRGDVDTEGAPDIVEVPGGSGYFLRVHWVHPVALGFPNEHVRAVVTNLAGGGPPSGGPMLLETGVDMECETGLTMDTE